MFSYAANVFLFISYFSVSAVQISIINSLLFFSYLFDELYMPLFGYCIHLCFYCVISQSLHFISLIAIVDKISSFLIQNPSDKFCIKAKQYRAKGGSATKYLSSF